LRPPEPPPGVCGRLQAVGALNGGEERVHVRGAEGGGGAQGVLREQVSQKRVDAGPDRPGEGGVVVAAFQGVDDAAITQLARQFTEEGSDLVVAACAE